MREKEWASSCPSSDNYKKNYPRSEIPIGNSFYTMLDREGIGSLPSRPPHPLLLISLPPLYRRSSLFIVRV